MPHNNTTANNDNNSGGSGKAWKNAKPTGLYISGAGALVGGAVALGFSMLKAAETLKGISRASDEIDQKLSAFDESVKSKDRDIKILVENYFSQKKQLAEEIHKISADASRRLDEAMEKNSRKNTEAIDEIRERFAKEIQRVREDDDEKFSLAVEQIRETNMEEWQARNEAWQRTYTDHFRKMSELEAKMAEYVHQAH
jgi:gas vesicle protein